MTTIKATATVGKYVTYQCAATVEEVTGKVRQSMRPADTELIGQQLSCDEESLLLGGASEDPVFASQLMGLSVGDIHSFEYNYPDQDPENFLSLPADFLSSNGIPLNEVREGLILNRDILVGKCTINGTSTDLEIVRITKKGKQTLVILDSNDPLRGLKIRYDIELLEIRDPTPEEIQSDNLSKI